MLLRGTLLTVVVALSTLAVLAACGRASDNGEAKLSGPRVASDAGAALLHAGAAHLVGTISSEGRGAKLDLWMDGLNTSGTLGSINPKPGELPTHLLLVGDQVYLREPVTFWIDKGFNHDDAAQMAKKWVLTPKEAADYYRGYNLNGFAMELQQPDDPGYQAAVTRSHWHGKSVLIATQPAPAGDTLSKPTKATIAATGPPYPLQIDGEGGDGSITFSDFGKHTPIRAPKDAVPLPLGRN